MSAGLGDGTGGSETRICGARGDGGDTVGAVSMGLALGLAVRAFTFASGL